MGDCFLQVCCSGTTNPETYLQADYPTLIHLVSQPSRSRSIVWSSCTLHSCFWGRNLRSYSSYLHLHSHCKCRLINYNNHEFLNDSHKYFLRLWNSGSALTRVTIVLTTATFRTWGIISACPNHERTRQPGGFERSKLFLSLIWAVWAVGRGLFLFMVLKTLVVVMSWNGWRHGEKSSVGSQIRC